MSANYDPDESREFQLTQGEAEFVESLKPIDPETLAAYERVPLDHPEGGDAVK